MDAEVLVFGQDDGLHCPHCEKSIHLEAVSKPHRWKMTFSYRCHACRGLLAVHYSLDEEGFTEGTWETFRTDVPLLPGEEA